MLILLFLFDYQSQRDKAKETLQKSIDLRRISPYPISVSHILKRFPLVFLPTLTYISKFKKRNFNCFSCQSRSENLEKKDEFEMVVDFSFSDLFEKVIRSVERQPNGN